MFTRYRLLLLLLLLNVYLLSCKNNIDINLSNAAPQLIIEGNLTDQVGTQTISISRSVNFDASNTYPGVSGAVVKVTDNTTGAVYPFSERTPGIYTNTAIFGRVRRNYTLRAVVEGKTYVASATMPAERVTVDSVTTSEPAFGDTDTKTVTLYYQDPPGVKNFYKIVMFVNAVQVKSVFVRNDEYSDGRMVNAKLYQSDIKIKRGDRVDVDLQGIDESMYNYWFTFAQQNNYVGGSATPTNPVNNFDIPVLGYFSVHTNFRRSFIVR